MSTRDQYPVLPSAVSAVRDIMTYQCQQLNTRKHSCPPETLSKSLQTRSWTCRHVFADASTNAHTYVQQRHVHERVCKSICIRSRTCSWICPRLHISAVLPTHTVSLSKRRDSLCSKLFRQLVSQSHILHCLLPAQRNDSLTGRLRSRNKHPTIHARTNRFKNSFMPHAIAHYGITFAVFDMFVCIYFMCLHVHVDLIQPLAARNN